jgi:phosphodiester glycosidase
MDAVSLRTVSGHARLDLASVAFSLRLADGAETTVYVSLYSLGMVRLRLVALAEPQPLVTWCDETGVSDAIVGGFFVRPNGRPLGELWQGGARVATTPFLQPWDRERACLRIEDGQVSLGPRSAYPNEPVGDLLQAGPQLVEAGRSLIQPGMDPEGFSRGQAQFDSDITAGRYPRAALGLSGRLLWAVVCDGRSDADCGMTLGEMASFMVELGAERAINLDGGGSTSLVRGGRLVNRPREEHGLDLPAGRPVSTALALLPA